MIINIRGTNGSGKSWVARRVLESYPFIPVMWYKDVRKTEGYVLDSPRPSFLLGEYGAAGTGGADRFKVEDDIEEIVIRRSARYNVLFEGIRVNNAHTRWLNLAARHPADYRIVFLDTPLEQCLENILSRRRLVGNDKPIGKSREHVEDHMRRNGRQWGYFTAAGFICVKLNTEDAVVRIKEWLA